jgi:integrase
LLIQLEAELQPATTESVKIVQARNRISPAPHFQCGRHRCFHALRNTYISQLFDAGLHTAQVQRLARHKDVRQTIKYEKRRTGEAGLVDRLDYPGLT